MKYIIRTRTGYYWRKRTNNRGIGFVVSWDAVPDRDEAHRFTSRKMAERFIKDGSYTDHTIEEVEE